MLRQNLRMLIAVELRQALRNLLPRFVFGFVVGFQKRQALLVDPRQFRTDRAFRHRPVERIFRGLHGVGSAIVAIDAIHDAPLALGCSTLQA